MKWAEYVARMGDKRIAYRFLAGSLRERSHLEYIDAGWRIIIKWTFKT